jgi:hypothetical protein
VFGLFKLPKKSAFLLFFYKAQVLFCSYFNSFVKRPLLHMQCSPAANDGNLSQQRDRTPLLRAVILLLGIGLYVVSEDTSGCGFFRKVTSLFFFFPFHGMGVGAEEARKQTARRRRTGFIKQGIR